MELSPEYTHFHPTPNTQVEVDDLVEFGLSGTKEQMVNDFMELL